MLLALMISLYFGMDKKIGSKPKLGSIAVVFKRIIDRLFSQKDEEEGCGSWRWWINKQECNSSGKRKSKVPGSKRNCYARSSVAEASNKKT
ncbi:hypothetical protein D5086_009328 [Populus alba]|uniref:Uncharacterized protein n=1 Tax=Populus alba TaxID=43335 RepID=A0ACC4CJ05_POPAL